ncbi:DUF5655 domain-containing protein [bacterium]|nr:DUF5655 domain-containing protein [bacterium]
MEDLFARSEPYVFELYQEFERIMKSVGPITVIPQKNRVALQVRVRFAGAAPRKSFLQCSFAFRQRREHPRFWKIIEYTPHFIGHPVRVDAATDF